MARAQSNLLRPITYRLNSTSVDELPRYAGFIAASILNCANILQELDGQKGDNAIPVHKLTTRVSSLLQDRTQEGRFVGIVLVKALIEAIGPLNLAGLGLAWVRSLLSCLTKQDPPQVKKLAILAIARIFLLTKGSQSMVREITTPSLPAFVSACLNLIKPISLTKDGTEVVIQSTLLQPVLECWTRLIRAFPSTFRPFVPNIRSIVLGLASQQQSSKDVMHAAFQAFATVHFCAPKDTAGTEWSQSVRQIIEALHQAADLVFRSVIEDWSAIVPRQMLSGRGRKAANEVQAYGDDAAGMGKWIGLQAGCTRAAHLFTLLTDMLTSQHAQAMRVPLVEVLDVTARFAAVLLPSNDYLLRENKEIGRDEREELMANLPNVHLTILALLKGLAATYSAVLIPVSRTILSQIWDIFDSNSFDVRIRNAIYDTMELLLRQDALPLHFVDAEHLASLARECCSDLRLVYTEQSSNQDGTRNKQNGTLMLDRQQSKQIVVSKRPHIMQHSAAWRLLPAIFGSVPALLLSSSIRNELDRTAVLVGHEAALLASVMHPPITRTSGRTVASIFPFLARLNSRNLSFEALIRPRMPVLLERGQSHTIEDYGQNEATEQGDGSLADTNTQDVTHHATLLLEDNAKVTEMSEPERAKKRDHTTIEDVSTSTNGDSSKKARFVSPAPSIATLPVATSEQELHTNKDTAGNPEGVMVTSKMVEVVPVISPQLQADSSPPALGTQTAVVSTKAVSGQDEDSDDSGIPEIDIAMSSDEDEENDEENESD